MKVKVYTPESTLRNPKILLNNMVRDLSASWELSVRLAIRDIQAQYRQAALGLLWVMILPLANAAVWLFVQGAGIVTIQETALPYSVYVFTGTIFWAIVMDAMNAPLQQTIAAKPMLAKINFPREAIILSGIYITLFNAVVKIAILIIVLLVFDVMPSWQFIYIPVALFALILTGTVLGLVITPIGMLYTDIGKGLPIIMQLLMFITPVVFPMPKEGWVAALFQYNPLTPLILTARDLVTGRSPDFLFEFAVVVGIMSIMLSFMWIMYRAAMPILIERMSA